MERPLRGRRLKYPGIAWDGHKTGPEAKTEMRRAKTILMFIVGLGLLMQIGTAVAFADDRGHRADKDKSDNKAQASTKSSASNSSASADERSSTGSQGGTSNSPPGNNGTIRIHEVGTAQSDHRNEPKVCDFYIDGFNFDSTSSGQWRIDGQGQTSGSNIRSGAWGPSDSAGNWRTQVIAPRLPDGHYKAAAWQLAPNNPPGGEKTKVFKVECETQSGDAGGQADTNGNGNSGNSGNSGSSGSSGNGGNGNNDGNQSNVGAQARTELQAAITNAENAAAQLAAMIAAGRQLLLSGTLGTTQELALNAAVQAALEAQAALAARLVAAQSALATLNIAINSGNAAQVAAAANAAQQAAASLSTAANAATQANTNVNTTTSAINATTSAAAPVVGSVQTLPTITDTQNAQTGMQTVVGGMQTLPSTSTGSSFPAAALGGVLMSIGVWLLRRPVRRNIG